MEQRTQEPSRLMTALAMLFLGLFPLWQDGSYAHITRSKWIGLLVLTGVTLLGTAGMLLHLTRKRTLRSTLRLGWMQVLALVYFGLVALSARFGGAYASVNPRGQLTVLYGAQRYEGLYTQLCYGAIFLCMSLRPVRLKWVMDAASAVLLLYCAIVAMQYGGVNVLGLFPEGRSIRTNYEFQGTIGNIDMVSGYVSLVMPLLLAGFIQEGRRGGLWCLAGLGGVMLMLCMGVQSGLIVLGVMAAALMLTALRHPSARWRVCLVLAGCLALTTVRLLLGLPWLDGTEDIVFPHAPSLMKCLPAMAGLLLLLAAWRLNRRPGRPWRMRSIAALTLAGIVAAAAVLTFAPFPEGSGLWEMQEVLHGRPQDGYGSERIGIWRLSLELSRLYPLWGTGPDTFLYAMEDYMFQTGQSLVQRFDNPHNLFLGVLVNSGGPAALAFTLLCAGVILAGLRKGRFSPSLGCLCYLAQGMFTFSICLVTPMFWALLGMLAACINVQKGNCR